MRPLVVPLALCLACGGDKSARPPSALDANTVAESPTVDAPKPRKSKAKPDGKMDAKPEPKATPPDSPKPEEQELQVEERESNPQSENVTLRLAISPPAKGVVMWGQKTMARFAPSSMDMEFIRPRGSGPLDLEIRADGYLLHHTRMFADRNDKTSVRLNRAEDAVGLPGYKPPAATK